jgi:transposase
VLTDSHDLPGDVAALHALILAERAERRAEQAARSAELVAKQIEIEHLRAMLAKLRRQRYGRSSEKLDDEIEQLELALEDAEVGQAQAEAKVAEQIQPQDQAEQQTSRRPRRPAARKPLPDHLPREIVILEPKFTCRCNDPSAPKSAKT